MFFQAIFDWVDIAGGKLASMSPIGTDLETVKQQIDELKVWIHCLRWHFYNFVSFCALHEAHLILYNKHYILAMKLV